MIKKLIFFILLISFIFFLIDFFYLNEEYIEFIISSFKSLFKGEERIKESTGEIEKQVEAEIIEKIEKQKAEFLEEIDRGIAENPPIIVEEQIVELINKEREKNNINHLEKSESLMGAARERSNDMKEKKCLSHGDSEGNIAYKILLKKMGISYNFAGENICSISQVPAANANAFFESWMSSEGHRKTMLNIKYKKIGVGVVDLNYIRIATAIFTD